MKQLGRYEILEEIGRGGFAIVYKARDTQLNRLVALKVLRQGLSEDPDFVRRFYQEAETAANFNHPNIVTIYDVGEVGSQLFISMEYIPGQNLQEWLDEKERPLTLDETLPILQPLAAALDYAHKQGVVHRDIKPSNIMIDEMDGSLRIVLTDFGLVKAMEKSVYATSMDRILGTPEYMAPEQTDPNRQDEVGPHTDLYAFGILAYRMLAGRVPFPGNSISTLHAHANLVVPTPRQFNADISETAVVTLMQMLSKEPGDRFETAADFINALRQPVVQPASTITGSDAEKDAPLPPRESKSISRFLGIAAFLIVVGLAVSVYLYIQGLDSDGNNPVGEGTKPVSTQSEIIAQATSTDSTPTVEESPTATPSLTPSRQSCGRPADWVLYDLQFGDTLTSLSERYNVTVEEIMEANCITDFRVLPGTIFYMPPESSNETSSEPPPNPTLGSTWIRPADDMVMVYVPAGTFLMGSDPESDSLAEDDEFPQHEVMLDGFWIDQTEVTNEQYAICVQDGSCDVSNYANDSSYNGDRQPVVGVSWFDAEAYCTWAGGQLPTEAQWEYAARGDDGRLYPWGNESPTCDLAQFSECDGASISVRSLSPAGDSWVDAADMAGSVWEWVADWYDNDYYETSPGTNPVGPETGDFRVLRGGSWLSLAALVRSALRNEDYPSSSSFYIGFRCAAPGP